MKKQIFIINGTGGAGKDSFVKFVSDEVNDILKRFHTVINFSSIDKVVEAAKVLGYCGGKSEKDRKYLSDLKKLSGNYNDAPFRSLRKKVEEFNHDEENILLFLHIREPEEIHRAVKEFDAKSILILRNSIKKIESNTSDKNVFDYKYDHIIENNDKLNDLREKAKIFVRNLLIYN